MKVSSLARVRTISAQRASYKPSPPLRLPGAQPRNWGQNLDRTRLCHWTSLRETAPDPASEALIAPALAPKQHPVSDHSVFGSVFLMSRITDQEPREGLSSLGPWGLSSLIRRATPADWASAVTAISLCSSRRNRLKASPALLRLTPFTSFGSVHYLSRGVWVAGPAIQSALWNQVNHNHMSNRAVTQFLASSRLTPDRV